jgi:hypothetical protein
MEPREDDLESTFRDIAAALPRLSTYDDEFVLSRDNLPVPTPTSPGVPPSRRMGPVQIVDPAGVRALAATLVNAL